MASGFELVPLTSQKHDPAWKHCQMFKNGDRIQLKCLYCGKVFKGGGIHRIKEHLAGQKGNGATCLRVQPDVRLLMQESLNSVVGKKRKKPKISLDEIVDYNQSTSDMGALANPCGIDTAVTSITVPETLEPNSTFLMERGDETMSKMAVRKKGRISKASLSVTPCGGSQCTIGSSKRANSQVSMAIGRFFYDVGIPLDAAKSDYFQPMIDAIASQEEAVVAPTYHDLRNCILKNSLQEARNKVDQCIGRWGKSGCSVLVDEWLSEKGRTFVNFLVYCPKGITFLRSVDISDILNSPDALCTLLKGVVEEVGTKNVLQVVTNTEERYVVASKRLSDDLPSVFWTPCASQCISLILEDFKRLDWISTVIEQAQYISRFIYNNSVVLNMMRRYTFGVDFLDTGASPLATDFATIKRMVQIKHNLQSMVTSGEWMDCPYSKSTEGFEMLGYISSQTFWSSCIMIVQLTDPLLRLLRLVSSEKRPALGYVYAGIFRVKEAIKKQLVDRKEYLVYWNIIDQRWGQLRNHPLHVAGFYFNPKFYNPLTKDICPNIPSPVFDCIEKLVPDPKIQDEIVKEIASYRSASGDFGREMAKRARNTLLPDEWWSTYGGGCPNLTRFAIHILSQTCSLVVPKPNFNTVQQMHETNNSLEHQRLSDLVYVHYNLLLGQSDRKNREQDTMDPIASENRGVVGDWLTVKEGYSEESGSSDWMTIDPPLGNTTVLGISSDDIEDLGSKFEDCEIFNIAKDEEAGSEDLAENVFATLRCKRTSLGIQRCNITGVTSILISYANRGSRLYQEECALGSLLEEEVDVSQLIKEKTVALFIGGPSIFNDFQKILEVLIRLYEEIKKKDDKFEIVYVSRCEDETSYAENLRKMPWFALPFHDRSHDCRYKDTFDLFAHRMPYLLPFGPDGKIFTKMDGEMLMKRGLDAYPFEDQLVDLTLCEIIIRNRWAHPLLSLLPCWTGTGKKKLPSVLPESYLGGESYHYDGCICST